MDLFYCPNCNAKHKFYEHLVGTKTQCQKCGTTFTIAPLGQTCEPINTPGEERRSTQGPSNANQQPQSTQHPTNSQQPQHSSSNANSSGPAANQNNPSSQFGNANDMLEILPCPPEAGDWSGMSCGILDVLLHGLHRLQTNQKNCQAFSQHPKNEKGHC